MKKIHIYWTFELDTGREVEVELFGYSTEFRKGDSVNAWHGPTPDEPAEFVIEEMKIIGRYMTLEFEADHYLWNYIDLEDVEAEYYGLQF